MSAALAAAAAVGSAAGADDSVDLEDLLFTERWSTFKTVLPITIHKNCYENTDYFYIWGIRLNLIV